MGKNYGMKINIRKTKAMRFNGTGNGNGFHSYGKGW